MPRLCYNSDLRPIAVFGLKEVTVYQRVVATCKSDSKKCPWMFNRNIHNGWIFDNGDLHLSRALRVWGGFTAVVENGPAPKPQLYYVPETDVGPAPVIPLGDVKDVKITEMEPTDVDPHGKKKPTLDEASGYLVFPTQNLSDFANLFPPDPHAPPPPDSYVTPEDVANYNLAGPTIDANYVDEVREIPEGCCPICLHKLTEVVETGKMTRRLACFNPGCPNNPYG
jgi:hypothetical protein